MDENSSSKTGLANDSPKLRPIPVFFMQQANFSTKKVRFTNIYINI